MGKITCNNNKYRFNKEEANPLISVVILAYNQKEYIKESIESVFSQDYKYDFEVVISDDNSMDGTYDAAKAVVDSYDGACNVTLRRNKENLGVVKHINRVVSTLCGKLFVFLGGDDILFPDYLTRCVRFWKNHGQPSCVASPVLLIDKEGERIGNFGNVDYGDFSFESSVDRGTCWVFSGFYGREVFDKFNALPENLRNEDQVLPFRSILLNGIGMINYPTRFYRRHGKNFTLSVKMAQTDSFAEWSSLYVEHLRNQINNYHAWLDDVDIAESWLGKEKAAWAKDMINDHIKRLSLQLGLLNKPSVRSRISLLNYYLGRKRMSKSQFAMLLSPYLLYLRRKKHE